MSSTAPPTRPSTATIANGTRYHSGSSVVSAPMGSLAMASLRSELDSASMIPKITRTVGAAAPPNVVQPNTPRPGVVRGR